MAYNIGMISVMNKRERLEYRVLVLIWLIFNLLFWIWWFSPEHWGNPILFLIMCVAFFYDVTLLPSLFLFYLGQMRRPEPRFAVDVKKIGRVAVISLTVPGSESLEIVERQLAAMAAIKYPHDSWILVDKEHSEEIETLANRYKVNYFCRHDVGRWGDEQVAKWNHPRPPFQEKTKAGNVNAWLDAFGSKYTHFTQLDIDHVPVPEYLDRVLGYFSDPKVAWVQAPSVYGNFSYWTARGSAEQELVLHGPLQMGFYGFCQTPFIIGSHCTYDMQSIKQIGGFQPTRAEDHLDTVCLASLGKQGVFLPEVIAVGDGPENFEMYLKQQFAWAYSLIQVLISYTPRLIKNYTFRQALQFLFVQTWYPAWSTSTLVLFLLPLISLVTNQSISHVNFWEFVLYTAPLSLTAFMIWRWSKKWHFPSGTGLTWRGIILHIARWTIVLQAFIQVLFRVKKPYMITIKGLQKENARPFAFGLLMPYLVLAVIALSACWFYNLRYGGGPVQGYSLLALEGAAMLLIVCLVVFGVDLVQMSREKVRVWKILSMRRLSILTISLACFLWLGTLFSSADNISRALFPYPTVVLKTPLSSRAPEEKVGVQPVKTEISPEAATKTYVVRRGDSLWLISRELYGDGRLWVEIKKTNDLSSNTIFPGQELSVPLLPSPLPTS